MPFNKKITSLALCIASLLHVPAFAAVAEEQAAQLGKNLTPLGAEHAANADGSIPAWDGGLDKPLPASDPRLPGKLFSDEKPKLSLTAANAAQYAGKLSEGSLYMLKNYPGYRMDVYPTHRTARAPQYIYDRTRQNATGMEVLDYILDFSKFHGGTPFPIPQNGQQAILNNQWNWRGADNTLDAYTWFVSSSGKRAMTAGNTLQNSFPWAYAPGRKDPWDGKLLGAVIITSTAPAYSAGEKLLIHGPADNVHQATNAWSYLTGQRRLRKAPNVQYDVPNNFTSGVINFDDANGFNGAIDRYDWKLVGKQELYVPYNNNDLAYAKSEDVVGEKFANPDLLRWELHRVWVVDATLRSGARHVVPKRRFYLDEDTWQVLVTDQWDAKGQLWKTHNLTMFVYPQIPVAYNASTFVYNLQARDYAALNLINDKGAVKFDELPNSMFTPQSLERSGVR